MHLVKINSFFSQKISNIKKLSWLLAFLCLFLITRVPRINNDTINPDGVNWHARSQQFTNGLKYFQFEKTYQHYHPGVTLMWIVGSFIELVKYFTDFKMYNHLNFYVFDTVAKLSLIGALLLLLFLAIFLLSKIINFYHSLIVVSLFSFEVFFIGNSRLLHLDALLTLLLFNSLLSFYIYIQDIKLFNYERIFFVLKTDIFMAVFTGLLFALTFLTKSIGIGILAFTFFYSLARVFLFKDIVSLKKFSLVLISFVGFLFLLFPALWVDPVYYLSEIFLEGERVGVRKGHEQIVLGESTTDGGMFFYPLVLLIKLTPFTLFILITGLVLYIKNNYKNILKIKDKFSCFSWYLIIFYFGYFIVMSIPTKKIDRYILVMYPFFAYLVYLSIINLITKFKKYSYYLYNILGILFLLFYIVPIITFFPYYFTYFSPIFFNASNAHKIIAQKPFGIGMYDLKNNIVENYNEVNLGFIDVKPIESIYPASKVFDIRETSTSKYNVLVLGPNEEMPKRVLESDDKFLLDQIVKINGLDYWRIYVKSIK